MPEQAAPAMDAGVAPPADKAAVRMDAAARRKAEMDAKMAARQKEAADRRARAKAKAAAMKAGGDAAAMEYPAA